MQLPDSSSEAIRLKPHDYTPSPQPLYQKILVALLLALTVVLGTGITTVPPAQASALGPGFHGGGPLFVGAFIAEADGSQVYCMDLAADPPLKFTSAPVTVNTLDRHPGGSVNPTDLAMLNYVLSRWGQSTDPEITAAVQMFTWSVADPETAASRGGDAYMLLAIPAQHHAAVLHNLGLMRATAATHHAVDPSMNASISMTTQYAGQLTLSATPDTLEADVSLTNAVFANGSRTQKLTPGTYPITGTPADGAPQYQISASASSPGTGLGAKINLYATPGQQRLLGGGANTPLSASASSPMIDLDFQPVITTQVASRFIQVGDTFADNLDVSVTAGTWTILNGNRIPLTAVGTLYGPFDEQPTENTAPPADAPVVGTEEVVLTGARTYASPGSLKASTSGFYTWVWEINKPDQGIYSKYLIESFADRFALVPETTVARFQPVAVSSVNQRLAVPGEATTDTLTVSSANGVWLKRDGQPIPVIFEGTAYQVPGTLPPQRAANVLAEATPIETVRVTATGPGTYVSPPVVLPSTGFVTWVWTMRIATQDPQVRDYIAADWADDYGIALESTSVRHTMNLTSEVREFNVHAGGRAFDTITVSGLQPDHGEFAGDGFWGADHDEITHTVYGPFLHESDLTDDLALDTAPVLTSITTPARNGVYRIGYTNAEKIVPTEPGYYVVVSSFLGDDRVLPFRSSPADILERFYVPGPTVPVTVITQATPTARVGEAVEDTALVQGTTIPTGAYLMFRAYGPVPDGEPASCEAQPFFVSTKIPVTQAGVYRSGTTTTNQAGNVYWVETLYHQDGSILTAGVCGAPGETTRITAPQVPVVVTKAVDTVTLGSPAHDVAIVTGPVPSGAHLAFEAYAQTGSRPVCDVSNRVFDTRQNPVPVPQAGEFRSPAVVFDTTGTFFWVETLLDEHGGVIHRGDCGADGETTRVTAAGLAQTGAPSILSLGFAALMLLTGGVAFTLWRRRKNTDHNTRRRTPPKHGRTDADANPYTTEHTIL